MGYEKQNGRKKHCKKCKHKRCRCSSKGKTKGGGHNPNGIHYRQNEDGEYVPLLSGPQSEGTPSDGLSSKGIQPGHFKSKKGTNIDLRTGRPYKGPHSSNGNRAGGGIISTAAAPTALYAFARMAHHGKSKKHSNKSRRRTRRKMRGGSVLGNALPSLVLYGLARGMRKTKNNNNNNNNNNNGRKTRKNRKRSRRGRRM